MKYFKIVLYFVLALGLVLFQFSVLNSWPGFWGRLNLILLAAIWLLIFYNLKTAGYFSLALGLIMDIFSFYPFGLYSLSLILVLLLANFIWQNLLTNRSIYSFLSLGFIMVFFYHLWLYTLIFIWEDNFFGLWWLNWTFWLNLLQEIAWIWLGIIISFYFFHPPKKYSHGLSFEKHSF